MYRIALAYLFVLFWAPSQVAGTETVRFTRLPGLRGILRSRIIYRCAHLDYSGAKAVDPVSLLVLNSDVTWDGTPFGIWPRVRGQTFELAKSITKDDIPRLMRLLIEKDQFVAAHVLLVKITGVSGQITVDSWYGLTVNADELGRSTFTRDDQQSVANFWNRWLAERQQ